MWPDIPLVVKIAWSPNPNNTLLDLPSSDFFVLMDEEAASLAAGELRPATPVSDMSLAYQHFSFMLFLSIMCFLQLNLCKAYHCCHLAIDLPKRIAMLSQVEPEHLIHWAVNTSITKASADFAKRRSVYLSLIALLPYASKSWMSVTVNWN